MKILFIENKYKTELWSILAKSLLAQGHRISFLVQNPLFKGKYGRNFIIPFPKEKDLRQVKTKAPRFVISADRNLNYFGKKDDRYFGYYFDKITGILDQVNPDLIIGESTLFHELLTAEVAKLKSILFVNPSSCRYPTGKFSFYKYSTLEPVGGSGEKLAEDTAIQMLNSIAKRSLVPDYMTDTFNKKKRLHIDAHKIRFKLVNPVLMTLSYVLGERYNTPSLFTKIKIENRKKRLIKKWNELAEKKKLLLNKDNFNILYPLQMQPEANIDVWGNKYRNQTKLIMAIHKRLKKDEILIVKANPKPKYEIEEALLHYIEANDNIVIPPIDWRMEQVLPFTNLIVTVSGTIAIEAPLMDIPVATLTNTLMNSLSSSKYLEDINQLGEFTNEVKRNNYRPATEKEKIDFINKLNSSSYHGLWDAPFINNEILLQKNINNLEQSLQALIEYVDNGKNR